MAAFGSGNLSSTDTTTKIRLYSGFTSTITNSFNSPATTLARTSVDSTPNSYCGQDGANPNYKQLSAFTSTVKSSWTGNDAGNRGVTIGPSNKFYNVSSSTKIQKHTTFSSTVTDSISDGRAGANLWDCSHDGTNILAVDFGNSKYMRYSAFTSTVKTSFSISALVSPRGGSWDGTNNLIDDASNPTKTFKKYSAFTSTVKTSFVPSSTQHGSEWDKTADRFPAAGGGTVILPRHTLLLMGTG